jgi:hypothetical protein
VYRLRRRRHPPSPVTLPASSGRNGAAGRSPRVALTVTTPATGTRRLSRGRLLPPQRRLAVQHRQEQRAASARLEITMTALPSSPRIAAPAYYHGRPVSFWITHLSPRRGGPRAAAPAKSQDRSRT